MPPLLHIISGEVRSLAFSELTISVLPHSCGPLELLLMSGDEPLGDGHTNWPSPEEYLTSNRMSCRKSHIIIALHNGIDKHEIAIVKKAPWCTNKLKKMCTSSSVWTSAPLLRRDTTVITSPDSLADISFLFCRDTLLPSALARGN